MTALNPLLLALILVILSRPRPIANLLGYWVGCLCINIPLWLGALAALHLVPSFESFALNLATVDPSSGIQPMKLVMGTVSLLLAVVVAVRLVQQRRKQPVLVGASDNGSTLVLEADSPAVPVRPQGRIRGAVSNAKASVRELWGRALEAWESGAVWVSVLMGLGYIAPIALVVLVNTIIVGSGAPVGTQIVAVLIFVFVMLATLELTLLSYVVAPRRTQAVLGPVHHWAEAHRMQILLGLFLIVGIWQLVTGFGLL